MKKQWMIMAGFMCLGAFSCPSSYGEPTGFSVQSSTTSYRIKKGDTLARIAHKYYGDGKLYAFLATINDLLDPHKIFYGRTLLIPPSPALPGEVSGATSSTAVAPVVTASAPVPSPVAEAMAPGISPLSLPQAPPPFLWRQEPYKIFEPGEKLTFAIKWKFLTVGYATMEVQGVEEISGRPAYHIITDARSAPFFDTFYKVRDVNESWMDVESLCSLKFSSRISENNVKKDETIILDQQKQQFQILESGQTGNIPLWVQDVLSSLYYLRTRELVVGQGHSIDTHSGDKSWPLNVNVIRKERIKVPAGEFDCFVVEPTLREDAGIFRAKGKLWVWLTDDDKKIPVMMRSSIAVGAIEAQLTGKN